MGLANYLSHPLTDEVTLNLRGEIFRDEDGARTGTEGTYIAVTAGVQWMPRTGCICVRSPASTATAMVRSKVTTTW